MKGACSKTAEGAGVHLQVHEQLSCFVGLHVPQGAELLIPGALQEVVLAAVRGSMLNKNNACVHSLPCFIRYKGRSWRLQPPHMANFYAQSCMLIALMMITALCDGVHHLASDTQQ